jgi:hypothetical protein
MGAGMNPRQMRPDLGTGSSAVCARHRSRCHVRAASGLRVYAVDPSAAFEGGCLRPARRIAGRPICAISVGGGLAERGIEGTGSAMAHSYDRWGRVAQPVPGAVALTGEGEARAGFSVSEPMSESENSA